MITSIMKNKLLVVLWLVIAGLWLVNCSPISAPKATIGASTPTAPAAPSSTPTSLPTATPLPGKVLLVAPDGTDSQPFQVALVELNSASGVSVETRQAIQKEDLRSEIKIVVLLSVPANLAELLAAAPQTQFVAVSAVDLPAAGNLSVIREKLENQAFVAGYLTALLSTDYRAGGLIPSDGPLGGVLQEAFNNGAHFYCGVCAPGWPLIYYPQVAALPTASDGPAWQSAAAGLFDSQDIDVIYVSPEASRQEVFGYLQGKTQFDKLVLVVGAQTPPDALKAQWAASIRFDLVAALQQAWPDIAAGKGGAVIEPPLVVGDSNPDLSGRLRLVKDVIDGLKAGTIYPNTVPPQ
jgi:hypothetical protein